MAKKLVELARSWRQPLALFVGWRIGLGLLAFWSAILLPLAARPPAGMAPYTPANLDFMTGRLLDVWTHWDGEWFLYVAQVGYRSNDITSPYFPLFPVLVRFIATLLGGNYLLAGVAVGALSAAAAFAMLYELARRDFGPAVARLACLCLAAYPTSFFLTACYSEGLFLALTLAAFLAARHLRNWWLAGLLVGLAALTRNLGIFLLVPLGWEWLAHRRAQLAEKDGWRLRQLWTQLQPLTLLALAGIPLIFFSGWLLFQAVWLGDPLRFMSVQSEAIWNRHSAWPWETVSRAIDLGFKDIPASAGPFREYPNLVDFSCWLFMALLVVGCIIQTIRRKLPVSYLIFCLIAFLLPLLAPAVKEPLVSAPRYGLLVFPAFIVLAQFTLRRPALRYSYLAGAGLTLALFFARFANWYWVA